MLQISIPCQKCGKPIRFREYRCAACGAPLTRDGRRALHERLAAASSDYRALQDNISSARTVILIIAVSYAGYGLIQYLTSLTAPVNLPEELAQERALLVQNLLIAAAFLVSWRLARNSPLLAILGGVAFWIVLQALGAIVVSTSLFAGLYFKAVAVILLLRGIYASVRANLFLSKLLRAEKHA